MDFPADVGEDEALLAGYVDSGIWALEEWLGARTRLQQHFEAQDDRED